MNESSLFRMTVYGRLLPLMTGSSRLLEAIRGTLWTADAAPRQLPQDGVCVESEVRWSVGADDFRFILANIPKPMRQCRRKVIPIPSIQHTNQPINRQLNRPPRNQPTLLPSECTIGSSPELAPGAYCSRNKRICRLGTEAPISSNRRP